jgi:hypothetical protein
MNTLLISQPFEGKLIYNLVLMPWAFAKASY